MFWLSTCIVTDPVVLTYLSSMSRLLSWLPGMLSKMFCSRCGLPPSSSRLEEILLFRFVLNDRTTHAFSVRYWNRIMLGCNHQLLYILAHWIFVDPGIFDLLRILRAWFIGTKCTSCRLKKLPITLHLFKVYPSSIWGSF